MARLICNLVLVLVLVLLVQGAGVASATVLSVHEGQEHCAGHDMQREECPCCPKGTTLGAGCTAQCSVAQAPLELRIPAQSLAADSNGYFVSRIIRDPTYVPLVPPPIV